MVSDTMFTLGPQSHLHLPPKSGPKCSSPLAERAHVCRSRCSTRASMSVRECSCEPCQCKVSLCRLGVLDL
eukprot:9488327-Alexandrium_andersonii.AAC.1